MFWEMSKRLSYPYTGNPGTLNHIVIHHRVDEHVQCQRFRKETAHVTYNIPTRHAPRLLKNYECVIRTY